MCNRISPPGESAVAAHANIICIAAVVIISVAFVVMYLARIWSMIHPQADVNLARAIAGVLACGVGYLGLLLTALTLLLPSRMWPVICEQLFWLPMALNVTTVNDRYSNSTCCVSVCPAADNGACIRVCAECVTRTAAMVVVPTHTNNTICLYTIITRVCQVTDTACVALLPRVGRVYAHAHMSPADASRVSLEPLQFADRDIRTLVFGGVCTAAALAFVVLDTAVPWVRSCFQKHVWSLLTRCAPVRTRRVQRIKYYMLADTTNDPDGPAVMAETTV